MTTEALYEELNTVDASRESRLQHSHMIIAQPKLIPKLLEIAFMVDDKISCKAAWVFEYTCSNSIELVLPHLQYFTHNLHRVHLDSAVRPMAKVCELLITAFYSKHENAVKTQLQPIHKEKIIESCFDWMIKEEKIAPKAYAMNTLYLLGTEYKWIHPELKIIIERDYNKQSAGFKARGRKILLKMDKIA